MDENDGINKMSDYQINAIATLALVDQDFQKDVLNGRRRERLRQFDLPVDLFEAIMSIPGDSLHHFIIRLNDLNAAITEKIHHPRSETF